MAEHNEESPSPLIDVESAVVADPFKVRVESSEHVDRRAAFSSEEEDVETESTDVKSSMEGGKKRSSLRWRRESVWRCELLCGDEGSIRKRGSVVDLTSDSATFSRFASSTLQRLAEEGEEWRESRLDIDDVLDTDNDDDDGEA